MIDSNLSAKARQLQLQAAADRVAAQLHGPTPRQSRRRRVVVTSLSLALFVVVFMARVAVRDPGALLANFYVVPIVLLAAEFGSAAGVLGGITGVALTYVWSLVNSVHVTTLGYLSRGAALLVAGVVVGRISERLREDVTERLRAQRNLSLYADQLERANHHLARTVERLEAVGEIARAVGDETDLEQVLSLVLAHGAEIVAARALAVYLLESDELHAVATGGLPADLNRSVPVAGTLLGRVVLSGAPLRATAGEVGDELTGVWPAARTAIVVPLTFRGELLGVLAGYDGTDGRVFEADDEELLLSVAASAATAVATVRSVAATRLRLSVEAADDARARWARELHDETLQGLSGARMLLAAGLAHDSEQALREAAGAADAHLFQEIRKLRVLITELRPAALDDLGLGPAIHSLAKHQSGLGGFALDTRLNLDEGERLPADTENAVYRIVQEALNNAVKHAGARRVILRVTQTGGYVEVTVQDDGRGFAPDRTQEGFGLTGMRERAELAGGRLSVFSAEGGPTCVSAVLPLPSRNGTRRGLGLLGGARRAIARA